MHRILPLLITATLLLCGRAHAARDALSLDVGGGLSVQRAVAPVGEGPAMTGLAPAARLGLRYALFNWLEVGAQGFYEAPTDNYQRGVTVTTSDGAFPGVLTYRAQRWGALGGVRLVKGMEWRLIAELSAGWSRRSYSRFGHIDDADPSAPVSYGLILPDIALDNLVLSPGLGLEWAAGDHWSLALLPRAELLLGPRPTWSITVPLTIGWSWYP